MTMLFGGNTGAYILVLNIQALLVTGWDVKCVSLSNFDLTELNGFTKSSTIYIQQRVHFRGNALRLRCARICGSHMSCLYFMHISGFCVFLSQDNTLFGEATSISLNSTHVIYGKGRMHTVFSDQG